MHHLCWHWIFNQKIDGCANNPENLFNNKICSESIFLVAIQSQQFWGFHRIRNKHSCGKGCMKRFCTSLGDHAKDIINFEKKKILSLTKEELNSHLDAKMCYICEKKC